MISKLAKRFIVNSKTLSSQPFYKFSQDQIKSNNKSIQDEKNQQDQSEEDQINEEQLRFLLTQSLLYQNTPSELKIREIHKNFVFDESEVQQLGISLNPYDQFSSDDGNVIFVRHGYSYHNYFVDKYINSQTINSKKLKQLIKDKMFSNSQEFVDTPLHPYGIIQCKNKAPYLHKLRIQTVYVSPMQRTLQTCVELFRNHPNKRKIQFIVQPQISEQLTKVSDIFDQNKFIDFIKTSYQKDGISFNCRYFYQHNWQANVIDEQFLKIPVSSSSDSDQETQGEEEAQQSFNKIQRHMADTTTIMNLMEYHKYQPLENHFNFLRRVLHTNKCIKRYSLKLKEQSLQKQKQSMVCVISHGYFIDTLIRKCFKEKHKSIGNCSFIYKSYDQEETQNQAN
ncbi:hypothetical protein ABPG72_005374 [Tetrahymena utriculariae]